MHPLLNQELAKQHIEALQHEARIASVAKQTLRFAQSDNPGLSFLRHWHNRTGILFRRPVVQQHPKLEEVRLEEIKPAVLTTFSVMHEVGLVSKYDDQFIEKFVETLEQELVHQSHCNCV